MRNYFVLLFVFLCGYFSVPAQYHFDSWTTDDGLNRLRRQIISSLSKADGLADNEVYPILRARDSSIYIGTTRGLSRYKDGEFSQIELSFANPLRAEPSVQSLWEDSEGRL